MDLLRALAIAAVVLGHWLVTVIQYTSNRRLTGHSALEYLPWAFPLTWLVQVMPVFFLVGGYANAASLTSHRRRGGDDIGWLQERSERLVRPTTVLFVVLALAALLARLLGADPGELRLAVWVASIPLWFLAAYLVVVLLAPVMWRLHERFGLAVPLVLVGLVAVGDVARLNGAAALGSGNFLFGWLAMHQLGFAWRDGRLPMGPRVGVPVLVGGLAALLLLTVAGPYPVNMIDIPSERIRNASPPTLALLAAATTQLGLVMLLHERAERWLHRTWPWRTVVAVNSVILTIFLWHLTAVVVLAGVLSALHLLPTPAAGTAQWWLWRVPWLIMLMLVLAVLVAIFSRFETHRTHRPQARPRWMPGWLHQWLIRPTPRGVLTVAGYVAVVSGLLFNNAAARTEPGIFGMPTTALVLFLLGAATLRLMRSVPVNPGAG